MDPAADVPREPIKDDDNKQQKGAGNRRVLQEIGNLVVNPPGEGKPKTHITKGLEALRLEPNDPAASEKKKNKAPEEEAMGVNVAANRQAKGVKKVSYKAEPEVIIISSDEEEENEDCKKKTRVLDGNKSKKHGHSRKKKVRSLTSVLTARSKAASGVSATEPNEQIVNIDAGDVENEFAVVEYVDEIYRFYKQTEEEKPLCDYMRWQLHINDKMRMILVDWLVEVHNKFGMLPETLYLTIDLVDRFLARKVVSRGDLQLVGIGAMLLASKYEEIWGAEVNDLVSISDMAYTREQILEAEKAILGKLEWEITVPTPYVFLVRFIKAIVPFHKKTENMALYIAETSLLHFAAVKSFRPSMIAAAAVYVALHTLNVTPAWTDTLKHYTGYSEDQLQECAKLLNKFHSAAIDSKLRAVYKKYSDPERCAVSLFPSAKMF